MSRPALSAQRAIAVLNYLASRPTEAFSLSDLSGALGINVASMHSLLAVLNEEGYVTRHPRLRTYTLGPSTVALGSAALESNRVFDIAREAARDLAESLNLEAAITTVAGDHIVLVAHAGGQRQRGLLLQVGQRLPLVPPLGAVFIAWADKARVASWLAAASDPAECQASLAGVRARGYSIGLELPRKGITETLRQMADAPPDVVHDLLDSLGRRGYQLASVDDDRTYDVTTLAAPVFGSEGEVVLALTLSGFQPALSASEISAAGDRLRETGIMVTTRVHGTVR
jgi:DNA-binding IclR family transcriptional regulator